MIGDFQTARRLAPTASEEVLRELSAYLHNGFDLTALDGEVTLPLADEPFVACWEAWAGEARRRGAAAVLAENLPQLRFPVRQGMSETAPYRAATRRGVPPAEIPEATGLALRRPEELELTLYTSPAGRVPLLVTREREDFVTLVRALASRNEPRPVPPAMGALMVAGYNNWQRIRQLQERWEATPAEERHTATWGEEMGRIRERRELYQDRFILLSDGPYSAVPAADLGLDEAAWRRLSLAIRRDHECTHYLTRRFLGSMRNHLLDELMADYAGMVAATGRFRAAWFLRFLGFDAEGRYGLADGRLEIYRGEPPLSAGAFVLLQEVARRAAHTLEGFDAAHFPAGERPAEDRARVVLALATVGLEGLAAPDAGERLERAAEGLSERLRWHTAE